MAASNYIKLQSVSLKTHPSLNETWVQARIAEDPAILGLGDLILRDKERPQPHAGRLDLLLQDQESSRRYEVEIQLGKTDESHIIRTLEYWDIERKRYPQYDHVAVIVAEEVTARFLNVIGLFNGTIPLIALQMKAYEVGSQYALVFTKVLDEVRRGLVEEDEETKEVTNREFWETQATKATVALVDDLLALVNQFDPALALKYNKFYIGLAKDSKPCNFAIFRPRKSAVLFEPRLEDTEEMRKAIEGHGLDVLSYDSRWGRYRINLKKGDIGTHKEFLKQVIGLAYEASAH